MWYLRLWAGEVELELPAVVTVVQRDATTQVSLLSA